MLLPSMVLSLVSIIVAFHICRVLAGVRVGLIAAVLLAFVPLVRVPGAPTPPEPASRIR